jgi:hypothetical protein
MDNLTKQPSNKEKEENKYQNGKTSLIGTQA